MTTPFGFALLVRNFAPDQTRALELRLEPRFTVSDFIHANDRDIPEVAASDTEFDKAAMDHPGEFTRVSVETWDRHNTNTDGKGFLGWAVLTFRVDRSMKINSPLILDVDEAQALAHQWLADGTGVQLVTVWDVHGQLSS